MLLQRLFWLLALLGVLFFFPVIIAVDHSLLQFVTISWLILNAVDFFIVNLPNYLTIQNLDLIEMAGPTDLLKPERFGGENFKRWQTRVKFWLMSMKLWWVISPQRPLTQEQQCELEVSSDTALGCLLSLLTGQLYDIYIAAMMRNE